MYDERLTDEETTEGSGEDVYEFLNRDLLSEINKLLVQYSESELESILDYLQNEHGDPSFDNDSVVSGIVLSEMPGDIQAEIEKTMRQYGLIK